MSPLSNIKMTELADALGLKLSTVSRVVHGNRLSIPVGRAIADHLGVPLQELFPRIHEKQEQIARRKEELRLKDLANQRPDIDTDALRKDCKHLMVDLGLDRRGSYSVIGQRLHESGVCVNHNVLVMTMTGYRNGRVAQDLLLALHELLKEWPQKAA